MGRCATEYDTQGSVITKIGAARRSLASKCVDANRSTRRRVIFDRALTAEEIEALQRVN